MSYTKKRTVMNGGFSLEGDTSLWLFGAIKSDENKNEEYDYWEDKGLSNVPIEIDDLRGNYKTTVRTDKGGYFKVQVTGDDFIKNHYYLFRFVFKSTKENFGIEYKLPVNLIKILGE